MVKRAAIRGLRNGLITEAIIILYPDSDRIKGLPSFSSDGGGMYV
jgi:hypothetical protein